MADEEHIPAWKRAGLVQKTTKKKDDGLKVAIKRNAEVQATDGPKKPPKRAKLPKDQRKPPPEADQLSYLRQFHEDRQNWKFSKQKQNWILRNVYQVEEKYEAALQSYLADIQGASRDRVIEDANAIISKWNEFMREEDKKESTEAEKTTIEIPETQPAAETTENATDKTATSAKPKGILKNAQPVEKPKPPTEMAAKRARALVKALTGTAPELEFLD